MASLEIVKIWVSPVSVSRHDSLLKLEPRKRVFRFSNSRRNHRLRRGLRVCSSAQENGDNQAKGEEPPESLFMKELKRRGMTPTSLLEGYEVDEEVKVGTEAGDSSKSNAAPSAFDQSLSNQRERSMALNSEGLEGLIPRGKLLLTIGGTFFLGFWPLIIVTVGLFSALYLYFGADFVHDASRTPISPPQYIDPYTLLEDKRISDTAPLIN
ncbi:PREDICTED: uncharacterized protein LOC104815219 [Tarenaya hassleriana]|uniref:uncharacterized protein LOC104815219 n=1 Tax=Tarenaya hassleriana TaxID=28532 RepID=UPI00053C0CB7|nr:PREDICTED: uncharacterized protein LOC104815219 [Tarenaya hassleriana]